MQAGCIQEAFDTEPSTVGGGGDPELDGSSEVVSLLRGRAQNAKN